MIKPDGAIKSDACVVRTHRSREFPGRVDHLRFFAFRARQHLQIVLPRAIAQVDCSHGFSVLAMLRGRFSPFCSSPIGRLFRRQLELHRRAAGGINHSLHNPRQLIRVISGHRRSLQGVTTAAIPKDIEFGFVVEWIAHQPLGVRQLQCQFQNVGFAHRQVQLRRGVECDTHRHLRCSTWKHISDGADGNIVSARFESISGKAIRTCTVADDGDDFVRSVSLRRDEHSFHAAFLRRGHGSRQHRLCEQRLCEHCQDQQTHSKK